MGKEKGKEKGKGKGRWKEDSLRKVRRTDGRTDTQVILYSVQCYALHWTENYAAPVLWMRDALYR